MATSSSLGNRPIIGLEGLKYAVLTESSDVSGGTPSYGTIYDLPGVVDMNWNPNASLTPLYGDDGLLIVGETVGDMKLDITLTDVAAQDLANMLGNAYVNGIVAGNTTDPSAYIAIGGKILRNGKDGSGNQAYEYVWFPKVKLTKPSFDYKTKESKIVFQTAKMTGQVAKLIANGNYKLSARTDDTNVIATTLTNWFTTVVTGTSVDLTALTCVATTGSGATKTALLTFSKASASGVIPFTMSAATIAAMASTVQCLLASSGALQTCTYALLSAGTGYSNSTITVTATTPVAATAVYFAVGAIPGLVDGSGVSVTPYYSGSITTHA